MNKYKPVKGVEYPKEDVPYIFYNYHTDQLIEGYFSLKLKCIFINGSNMYDFNEFTHFIKAP